MGKYKFIASCLDDVCLSHCRISVANPSDVYICNFLFYISVGIQALNFIHNGFKVLKSLKFESVKPTETVFKVDQLDLVWNRL